MPFVSEWARSAKGKLARFSEALQEKILLPLNIKCRWVGGGAVSSQEGRRQCTGDSRRAEVVWPVRHNE